MAIGNRLLHFTLDPKCADEAILGFGRKSPSEFSAGTQCQIVVAS